MDFSQLSNEAKKWYPIYASILSSFLNILAFMIGIKWSVSSIFWVLIAALFATMLCSSLVILYIFRKGVSKFPRDYTILESNDIYDIKSPSSAIYRREFKILVLSPFDKFEIFPSNSEQKGYKIRVYQDITGGNKKELNFTVLKRYGRKIATIYLDRELKKGETSGYFYLEYELENAFTDTHESVAVSPDNGQIKCTLEVILFKKPVSCESIVYFHNNFKSIDVLEPVTITDENYFFHLKTDFSKCIKENMNLDFCTSWVWNPSVESDE